MVVNGKKMTGMSGINLQSFIEEQGYRKDTIVVERNMEIVPKEDYEAVILSEDDVIEIVTFMGGGEDRDNNNDKDKDNDNDALILGGHKFNSRFILGSGKYNVELIDAAIKEAGAEIITLALRRANSGAEGNILDYIPKNVTLLPNTSGARNADEAVRIARLSRELGCGDFVKIEVIHDSKYLLPDNYETIKATQILAREGFVVLPYMYPDLNVARELVNAGAAAIMPLAAPIGTNKGICTREFIRILIEEIDLPIIVDAGIGRPSQACEVMEMGVDAVMSNTAIATAGNIPMMARAFKNAINAGREAYLSGLGRIKNTASASSPLTGFLR